MEFKGLFQRRAAVKWGAVCSTQDIEKYYRIVGTLKNNRIPFETKTIRSKQDIVGKGETPCIFQVLVPYKFIDQAQELIQ